MGLKMAMRIFRALFFFSGILTVMLLISGCGAPAVRPTSSSSLPQRGAAPEKNEPSKLAYTIQAGAFASVENAARLARSLQQKGLDATYFVARRGLYKVRFGNFPTKEEARARADDLQKADVIEEFYVVSPGEHAAAFREARGETYLREELVRAARSFLGVPYLWGGNSAETGFDCSGLTMAVYRLCGFDLPRTSRDQFTAGSPVERTALAKGDLLFFADRGGKVSHVGLYVGDGNFIHAPGIGKKIRTDALSKRSFSRSFVGARSYL